MARNPKFSRPLFDPIELDHDAKYDEQGITRLSNIDSVVERDDAGNVLFREDQENQLLSIETIYKKILNSSVIKVLDTQFNYFKFPVRVNETGVDINLDIDLDIDSDNVSAKLTIPVPVSEKNQPQNYQKIYSEATPAWYNGDDAASGYFRELQFNGGPGGLTQPTPNSYTITEDMIETLKNENKTIRFKIFTQYRTIPADGQSEIRMRLKKRNPRFYDANFKVIELLTESFIDDSNNPHDFQNKADSVDYPVLSMTYIVDMDAIKPGDIYTIVAGSRKRGYILAQNSYWDIDIVDIPVQPSIYGSTSSNSNVGVYQFSKNTLVRNSQLEIQAKRSTVNDQEVQIFT